ncbi:MAG: helix-turn-helix transcriptional regulator [Bacteroidetes bacterium]|nr:helix-turn-helix transcriptional regulator [Bacteroidota bacterium]
MNKKLKVLRQKKGLSQENIALELGISQKAYSKIENGQTLLNHEKLFKIAEILEISPKDICPIQDLCNRTHK